MTPNGSSPDLGTTLDALDAIVASARSDRSPIGIFPSMYRSVTAEIRDAIHDGFFDDSPAMERLAVMFAGRYLDAYNEWISGDQPSTAWRIAFEAATDGRRRMIAQHLLAGMNAHINLDLGIVAAAVAGNDAERLHDDFFRVNQILFQKLDGLQGALGSVSTRMAWIDRLGGTLDERMMRLAIGEARDRAWDLTDELIERPADAAELIAARDDETADLGRTILGGSLPVRVLSQFVARSETSEVHRILDAFSDYTVDLDAVEAVVRLGAGKRMRET
jgi:hypothetical protein